MKTWEIIKKLTENTEKKFKNIRTDDVMYINDLGEFVHNNYVISVNDEWEEVIY